MAEKSNEHIEAPEYYDAVMDTARKLASKEATGIGSYSGEEAVDEFQRFAESGAGSEAKQQFINAKGELTRDTRDAVAAFIHEEGNLSAHLYFRERFNQPLDQ